MKQLKFYNFQNNYVVKMEVAKPNKEVAKPKRKSLQKPNLLNPSWKDLLYFIFLLWLGEYKLLMRRTHHVMLLLLMMMMMMMTGWEANRSTYLKPPQIPKMQYWLYKVKSPIAPERGIIPTHIRFFMISICTVAHTYNSFSSSLGGSTHESRSWIPTCISHDQLEK